MKKLLCALTLFAAFICGHAQEINKQFDTVDGYFLYEDLIESYYLRSTDYVIREPVNVASDEAFEFPLYGLGVYALPYQVIDMVVSDSTNMNPQFSIEWEKKVRLLQRLKDVSYLEYERALTQHKMILNKFSRSPYIRVRLRMVVYNVGYYKIGVPDISNINHQRPIFTKIPVYAIVKLINFEISPARAR